MALTPHGVAEQRLISALTTPGSNPGNIIRDSISQLFRTASREANGITMRFSENGLSSVGKVALSGICMKASVGSGTLSAIGPEWLWDPAASITGRAINAGGSA